ncbi:unnamed protein product [Adineta ricciae]|uniref:PLAT domain-containing protein n=1 Tax=Adineta ricciae TaxID=249248 RepID=A0A815BTQ3_ADIRI|nr:unnamed protein product [Adineta ricciae]CAF1274998.1 unnamed protein product [Adineta ricciae]
MSHLETSTLARYNSLADPYLQSYFSNERMQSHLKRAGLISNRGEILSDPEYRTRLAQREHRRHVRHMLAENIVSRAIDMERSRNAEMKRYFETMSKAALVNNIKESRRRAGGNLSGYMSNSSDMAMLSVDSSWAQPRPRSANYQSDNDEDYDHIPRVQSASMNANRRTKPSSKTRKRRPHSLQRPKSAQRPSKYPDTTSNSPPCQITMVYYGPHTKVDYDRMVFSDVDEVMVMQQHCGGENLIVYKGYLKPGAEFTFNSRRRSDYPFGLSLYVKGLIDSRISTCCEYKHRHGVRLGGDRGHFAIVSVAGSKPCIKCRFEKEARLKKYAESPKGKQDKPLTVSVSVSDGPKNQQTPVHIPVRHASMSNDSYSQDFDRDDQSKKDGYGTDSSVEAKKISKRSSKSTDSTPKVAPRAPRISKRPSSEKSGSTFDISPEENSSKKTWQIIFHPSNLPNGSFHLGSNGSSKKFFLKFSFILDNEDDETEMHELNMKPLIENSKSAKPYSMPVKLQNQGKPVQISLKMITTQDEDDEDDDEEQDIKWHLDYIEVIDPETQSHYIFPCKSWIVPFEEKYVQLSRKQTEVVRPSSAQSNSSRASSRAQQTRQPSAKARQQPKLSSRSSTPTNSPKPPKASRKPTRASSSDEESKLSKPKPSTRASLSRRISADNESDWSTPKTPQKPKSSSRSSTPTKPVTTAKKPMISDQESDQSTPRAEQRQSPIKNDSTRHSSPESTEIQVSYRVTIHPSKDPDGNFIPAPRSRMFVRLNDHKKETILTTDHDQLCPTFEAGIQQTFVVDLNQEQDESVKKLTIGYVNTDSDAEQWKIEKIVLTNMNTRKEFVFLCNRTLQRDNTNYRAEKTFELQTDRKRTPTPTNLRSKSSNDSDDKETQSRKPSPPVRESKPERSHSFESMNDDDANYKTIFKKLDPENKYELGSQPRTPPPRPKTRRGSQNSSEKHEKQPVYVPPMNFDELTNRSGQSNDQDNQKSQPTTTSQNRQHQHQLMYPPDSDDEEDEQH